MIPKKMTGVLFILMDGTEHEYYETVTQIESLKVINLNTRVIENIMFSYY